MNSFNVVWSIIDPSPLYFLFTVSSVPVIPATVWSRPQVFINTCFLISIPTDCT